MHLVDDWKAIVRRAWSWWIMALISILSLIEAVFPFYTDMLDRTTAAIVTAALAIAGMVARLIAQKGLSE